MKKLNSILLISLAIILFSMEAFAQNSAFVEWKCVPPDSQAVSAVQGNVMGLSQIGSPGFVVRSYSGTAAGPLGTNQRWWPYQNGAAVSWGNETDQVNTRYVQFAVIPKPSFNFHADSVSMYLSGGGTSSMRANISYSVKSDFSNATKLNSLPLVLGNGSDTLFVRVYPYYTGSPSTSKYLYIQDAKIAGTTRGITYPATASWPLTNPGTGGTGYAATTTGQVTAPDEYFNNTEINQYSGPNNSQRIRMANTGNTWPAGLMDQIDTVFVQFSVSPKPGYTFYANTVSLDMGAKSSNTFKANLWYSTDPDFKNATKLNYTTSDTSGNNFLNSVNLESYKFNLNATVNSGQTFYFRVYPWNQDAAVKSGKYLCLQNILIGGDVEGHPASASITWDVDKTNIPTTTGSIIGSNETYSKQLYLYGYSTSYPTIDGQNVTSARITTSADPKGSWQASTGIVNDFYVQYTVSPKHGGTFYADSVSLLIGCEFTNNLRAAVYYSKDSTFATKNLLIPDTSLTSAKLVPVHAKLNETVNSGETLYLRVYPYDTQADPQWKLVLLNNVQIFGTTVGVTADPPTVTTADISDISTTFAKSGGNVSTDGGATVTAKGVCWNTTGNATITDGKTNDGTGSGSYVSIITGLTAGAKYYLRAYATNEAGTAYGNEVTFATLDSTTVPTVTTTTVSSIMVKTALSGGTVTSWGGDTVKVKGVCWNTKGNPTVTDSKTENGNGLGAFTSTLYPLAANTTYYVRAYAANSKGTGYGLVDTFKTQSPAPTVKKIVAKDGSGDYTSVQAAFNDVPDFYTGSYFIIVKKGTYYEKLLLSANKTNVILYGEDRDNTILTYDDYAGKNNLGTSGSYSVGIDADDFSAYNITFRNTIVNDNSHPGGNEQAVALRVNGDRQQYYNCKLLGYQDTYYTWGGRGTGRTYMRNCYIEGSVDFIFGRNIVVFDSCEIHINRNGGTLTAASTDAESKFGYVFLNNKITADSVGFDGIPITSFLLGRPWQASPRTVFIKCDEPISLNPAGWSTWNVAPGLYAEYKCTGLGSGKSGRLTSISRQLTDAEAATYTIENIFSKNSNPNFGYDWMPDKSFITSVEETGSEKQIPKDYELNQNYPNPFNPSTKIRYSIPQTCRVSINIYNILGETVTTLVDNEQAPGRYEVNFNASNLASGIYFYRIKAGNYIQAKKMMLLK